MCAVNCSARSFNLNVQQGDDDQREVSTADTCFTFSSFIVSMCLWTTQETWKHRHSREGETFKNKNKNLLKKKTTSSPFQMRKKEEMKEGNAYFYLCLFSLRTVWTLLNSAICLKISLKYSFFCNRNLFYQSIVEDNPTCCCMKCCVLKCVVPFF